MTKYVCGKVVLPVSSLQAIEHKTNKSTKICTFYSLCVHVL